MNPEIRLQLTDLLDKVIKILTDPDKPRVQIDREVLLILDRMKKDIWRMRD